MTPIEKMLAEHECERQIKRFATLNDNQDYNTLVSLFTEDATFARPSQPDDPIQGRDKILTAFNNRPARFSRHIISNVVVEVESAEEASAVSYILLFSTVDEGGPLVANAPHLVGTFRDRLRKENGQWLFCERRGSVDLRVS